MFNFIDFFMLSNIFFGVGYIQSSNLFPEPLNPEEEKIYLQKMK